MNVQDDFHVNATPATATPVHCGHQKVLVWGAIIAGALVAFGLTFLLQLFDKALGIQIFRTASEGAAEGMIWGGFIASIIGIVVTMFFAGWVSGHVAKYHIYNNNFFSGYPFARHYGLLYGFLTWCLALILSLAFMTHMSAHPHYFHGSANTGLSVVGMTTHQAASEMTEDNTQKNDSAATTANNDNATNDKDENTDNNMPDINPSPMALSLFLTFILFFLGAIASCFGGYCGLTPYKDREINSHRTSAR